MNELNGVVGELDACVILPDASVVVGGNFSQAGNSYARNVARWTGRWEPLGSGLNGRVLSLCMHNGQIIAGGTFPEGVAVWTGFTWERLGSTYLGSVRAVRSNGGVLRAVGLQIGVWTGENWTTLPSIGYATALTVYDGSVFVGTETGAVSRLVGDAWVSLPWGNFQSVADLAVHQGKLIVAGTVTTGPGQYGGLRAWTTGGWTDLGTGTNGPVSSVCTLGTALYAVGNFSTAGSTPAAGIAKWAGSAWQALGVGVAGAPIAVAADSQQVVVGGSFVSAGGIAVASVARWSGGTWTPIGSGIGRTVQTLHVHNGMVVAGGFLTAASGGACRNVATLTATGWSPIPGGVFGSPIPTSTPNVKALTTFGSDLIVVGYFTNAGSASVTNLARWDGVTWSPLGGGANGTVTAMCVFRDRLIVGGSFSSVAGVGAQRIAWWDGVTWRALGGGITGAGSAGVLAMTVFRDRLIVGGTFDMAGTAFARSIAAWDGASWSTLDAGVYAGGVAALATYRGDLIAGGYFQGAGASSANNIARWDGVSWHPLGDGTNSTVDTLAVQGGYLIAGGSFTVAGDESVGHLASWDGRRWRPLGKGVSGDPVWVSALLARDDDLLAAGEFTAADLVPAADVAKFTNRSPSDSAVNLNGVSDYLLVGPAPNLQFERQFTVEAWIRPTSMTGTQRIISTGFFDPCSPSSTCGWGFGHAAGRLLLTGYGRRDYFTPRVELVPAVWTHVAATIDEFYAARFYVNGALVGESSGSTPFVPSIHPCTLGCNPNQTEFLNGSIDELRVWNTARSSAEISAGFLKPASLDEPNLIAYWRFADAPGQTAFDSVGVADASLVACTWVPSGCFVAPCDGDTDMDRDVDQDDIDRVLFAFGSSVPPRTGGDLDGDGQVSQDDIDIVLFNYGRACE